MTRFEEIIGKELPFKVGDKVREYRERDDGKITYVHSTVIHVVLGYAPRFRDNPFIQFDTEPLCEGTDTRNYGYRSGNSIDFDSMEDLDPLIVNGTKYHRLQLMSEPPYEGAV